jgi:hypothetical protein
MLSQRKGRFEDESERVGDDGEARERRRDRRRVFFS